MVHDLEQDVEDIWVGFFNFIQKDDTMGVLPHRIGQQSALVETNISWRGSNQSGNGMLLHVFTHVKTLEVNSHDECQLLGEFRLSHPGRTGEKERADGLFRTPQSGTGTLDRLSQNPNRIILTEDLELQSLFQIFQLFLVIGSHLFDWNPGDAGNHSFDILGIDRFPLRSLLQAHQ